MSREIAGPGAPGSASRENGPSRGYAIAVASAAVLSTTAVFIRHLTVAYRMPPLVLAFWRDLFTAIILFVILRVRRRDLARVSRRDLGFLVLYGFVLAGFNALWTTSVALTGAAIATVLGYTSAAYTVFLGRWLFRERLDAAKLLAVASTLGGCVLVSGALDAPLPRSGAVGVLVGVLSGLGYAGYTLFGRAAAKRGLDPWTTVLYVFGIAAALLGVLNLAAGGSLPGTAARPADLLWLGTAWKGWGFLALLAAGPTLAGFGLYNLSLCYLPAGVVNLVVTLEPVFTTAVAAAALDERLSPVQVAGGTLILGGVAFLRVHEARRSASGRVPGRDSPGAGGGEESRR